MPQVHDVRVARRDGPLYEDLFRRTADVAAPAIARAVNRVTSTEAAGLLRAQLEGLRGFLLEEPSQTMEDAEFIQDLQRRMSSELTQDQTDEPALVQSLALEFATNFWDALLLRMASHAKDAKVGREDLEMSSGGTDEAWADLDEVLLPYALDRAEAAQVLASVLRQMQQANAGDVVPLPLGLSIDKGMLSRVLAREPEPKRTDNFLREFLHLIR